MARGASAADAPRRKPAPTGRVGLVPERASIPFLAIAALCSSWFFIHRVILNNLQQRSALFASFFADKISAPARYWIFEQYVARGLASVYRLIFGAGDIASAWAYGTLMVVTFCAIYWLLYALVRPWFGRVESLLVCAVFAAIVPFAITGPILEGDFVLVVGYLAGLLLAVRGRDAWIPLVVAITATSRFEIVYFLPLYAAFLAVHGQLVRPRKLGALVAALAAWGAVYVGIHAWRGWVASPLTTAKILATNLTPRYLAEATIPLWLAVVVPLVVLAVMAWPRSNAFFRASLFLVVAFAVDYFFRSFFYDYGLFVPALMLLVIIAMQPVLGVYAPASLLVEDAAAEASGPVAARRGGRRDDAERAARAQSRGTWILLASLAAMSSWFVIRNVILDNLAVRVDFVARFFDNAQPPPYRYRLFEHDVARVFGFGYQNVVHDPGMLNAWSYGTLVVLAFAALYALLYALLRLWFSRTSALLGCAAFAFVVPLTVTGAVLEGDFVTVVAYLVGLHLMLRQKEVWLPLVVLIATTNREQMIFLVVLYAGFLLARGELARPRKLAILAASGAAWALVYFGIRAWKGPADTPFTTAFVLQHNLDPGLLASATIPLWIAAVLGFAALCLVAWRRSPAFLKVFLLLLVPYAALFFVNGFLYELAKFLPAFLVLIPMAIQPIVGQYAPAGVASQDAAPGAT